MSESIEEQSRRRFERRMLTNYNLDEDKLRRLGFFFLIHSHVDIKLIALVVKAETERRSKKKRALSLDDRRNLSVRWSGGTFTEHLKRAKARNLLGSNEARFAEETNRARDHFAHFEVGRFQLPHYFGKDVTSEEGYRAFLTDAMTFDVNVKPFP